MADDDIERLLREVEAELGRSPSGSGGSREPVPAAAKPSEPGHPGTMDRLRAGVPRGIAVGAVWGFVVGGVFSILPVVDGLSGALAAFATGFGVSVAGRLRRR
jgi:hypothetical protein